MSPLPRTAGVIGLGTMGTSFARNLARNNITVSVHNRTYAKTAAFLNKYGNEGSFAGFRNLKGLVQNIERPRRIFLFVPAGSAVDTLLARLRRLLAPEDIVIDCGNSFWKDTERRKQRFARARMHWIGCGVSGGKKGALEGPSLMPGGDPKGWKQVRHILTTAAARDFHGTACVAYLGTGGSGHFVKMVHNAIEYGILQLLAESYHLLKSARIPLPRIQALFRRWNSGTLSSFLLESAARVLAERDPHAHSYLIEHIQDQAGEKGEGKWAVQEALAMGIPLPITAAAVFTRFSSQKKEAREAILHALPPRQARARRISPSSLSRALPHALFAASLIAYAEGFFFLQKAKKQYEWSIPLEEVARIWEGGCIIRSRMLEYFHTGYKHQSNPKHPLALPNVADALIPALPSLATIASVTASSLIPAPAFHAAFDTYRSLSAIRLPTSLIQGIRDLFGAHGYERDDSPGIFHTSWDA